MFAIDYSYKKNIKKIKIPPKYNKLNNKWKTFVIKKE